MGDLRRARLNVRLGWADALSPYFESTTAVADGQQVFGTLGEASRAAARRLTMRKEQAAAAAHRARNATWADVATPGEGED